MSDLFSEERERHFPMELPCNIVGKTEPLETYFELEDALEDIIFPPSSSISRWQGSSWRAFAVTPQMTRSVRRPAYWIASCKLQKKAAGAEA